MYIQRSLQELLRKVLSQFPACLVTGPRQAGKSTLLKHYLTNFNYANLDSPILRELANNDPELFLSTHRPPLFIDEIQYAPNLLSYIKIQIDNNRRKTGQYVLTGSQTFQAMKGVSESLAGRIALLHLYPLSWQEIQKVPKYKNSILNDTSCAETMISGFYPEFYVTPNLDPQIWFGSYLSTYIERDVRNIKAITDLLRFQTFISLLATRAGQLLNMNEIAREVGISQPTVKDWISILESTWIIHLLQPFHRNIGKRLVKMPKLYFVDTGLLCYLLGVDTPERLFRSSERGHLFENMVIMECLKQLACLPYRSECYFYRTSHGTEVDLLVERFGGLEAYEIKFTKTLSMEYALPLQQLRETLPINKARVLTLHKDTITLKDGIEATHWGHVLQ